MWTNKPRKCITKWIIKVFESSRAHSRDNISINKIRICGESIASSHNLLFETSLKEKKLPDKWKLANVLPVHKKEKKALLKTMALLAYVLFLVKYMEE